MTSLVGSTLIQLVSAIAPELGPCQPFTTTDTGGGPSLIVSGLFDGEAPAEKYGGHYVYNVADSAPNSLLGQQGRVTRNGYTGSFSILTCATNFTATPHSGASWLLLGAMPVLDQDGLTGIRTCVNRAIRKMWMRYWYPFTAVDGQVDYDLGALWFASRSRFIRLMDPIPGGTMHPAPASQSWDVVQNGDVWTLQLGSGYPAGQTFWLVMDAPINFRLKQSGTWTNQSSPTAGLVLGADACLGPFNDIVQCSLYECMKQLSVQAGGNRKAYWQNEIDKPGGQKSIVSFIKSYQMDDDGVTLGEGPSTSPDLTGSRGPKSWWGL